MKILFKSQKMLIITVMMLSINTFSFGSFKKFVGPGTSCAKSLTNVTKKGFAIPQVTVYDITTSGKRVERTGLTTVTHLPNVSQQSPRPSHDSVAALIALQEQFCVRSTFIPKIS